MRRAITAAVLAVWVAVAMGALAARAQAASTLVGMTPGPLSPIAPGKSSTAALKQLLADTKSGAGAKLGPFLSILQKAYGAQPLWHDGGLRAKLPPLHVQDGYVRISAYGDDVSSLKTQLVGKGMLDAVSHDYAVTGRVPVTALTDPLSVSVSLSSWVRNTWLGRSRQTSS